MSKIKRYQWLALQVGRFWHFHDEDVPRASDIDLALHDYFKQHAPSGSGIDCGTKFELDRSSSNLLVMTVSFHHMNEQGMYDGWTSHTIRVKPDLRFGFGFTISGSNRNDIKDYLGELYQHWLSEEVDEYVSVEDLK